MPGLPGVDVSVPAPPSPPTSPPLPSQPGRVPSQRPGVRFNCCFPTGPAQAGKPGPRVSPDVPRQGPLAFIPCLLVSGPVCQTPAPAHRRGESPASSGFSGNKGPLSRPLRAPGCLRQGLLRSLRPGPRPGGFARTGADVRGELSCPLGLPTPAGAPAAGFPPGGRWVGPEGKVPGPRVFPASLDWL